MLNDFEESESLQSSFDVFISEHREGRISVAGASWVS